MENFGKLKVLFVTHCATMGGANHSMLQLIRELRENYNIAPYVLLPKKKLKYNVESKCKEMNIPYMATYYFSFKDKSFIKSLVKLLFNLVCFPIIIFKLRKSNFDIVHSNGSVVDFGAYFSRWRHIKHIWHLREFGDVDFGLYCALGKWYEKLIYNNGDCFVAISRAVLNAYIEVIPKQKIELVYNGIAVNEITKMSNHCNEILQFCVVGKVQSAKNQLETLEAVALLVHKGYNNFHLNIIGEEDPSYMKILVEYVDRNKLQCYVTFWGESDNIHQILSLMDVGLMASRNEAFGRVTVEYMLHNLAVIASNTGANLELVCNNETGFVYKLGEIEELASKMILCIENRALLCKIASSGRMFAEKNFSSLFNTASVYNLYSRLLQV